MSKLISIILLHTTCFVIFILSMFFIGKELQYIDLSDELLWYKDKITFFSQQKEMENVPVEKYLSKINELIKLAKNNYKPNNYIEINKLDGDISNHFVDYSKQKVTLENDKLFYSVLTDDYTCEYTLNKIGNDLDSCTKVNEGSVYKYEISKNSSK